MKGVVDTGSDITILGGEMFKKVASVARSHKKDFHPPDKKPRNYDQQPFTIDGCIDIDVVFQDKAMKTAVYVKMDAPEDLLISEGVCRQLGILTYHPEVQPFKVRRAEKIDDIRENTEQQAVCQVLMVRVRLVHGLRLLPNQHTVVEVEFDDGNQEFKNSCSVLVESVQEQDRVYMEDGLLQFNDRGTAVLSVVSHLGLTQKLEKGKEVGAVVSAELLDSTMTGNIARCSAVTQELEDDKANDRQEPVKVLDADFSTVRSPFMTRQDERMQRLRELVDIGTSPEPENGKKQVMVLLEEFNICL